MSSERERIAERLTRLLDYKTLPMDKFEDKYGTVAERHARGEFHSGADIAFHGELNTLKDAAALLRAEPVGEPESWMADECLGMIREVLLQHLPMEGCPPMFYPEAIHNAIAMPKRAIMRALSAEQEVVGTATEDELVEMIRNRLAPVGERKATIQVRQGSLGPELAYVDYGSLPVGTHTLYVDFANWKRVVEYVESQGFAVVPLQTYTATTAEPASPTPEQDAEGLVKLIATVLIEQEASARFYGHKYVHPDARNEAERIAGVILKTLRARQQGGGA